MAEAALHEVDRLATGSGRVQGYTDLLLRQQRQRREAALRQEVEAAAGDGGNPELLSVIGKGIAGGGGSQLLTSLGYINGHLDSTHWEKGQAASHAEAAALAKAVCQRHRPRQHRHC